jgi:acyl-CoA thioesterase YciA
MPATEPKGQRRRPKPQPRSSGTASAAARPPALPAAPASPDKAILEREPTLRVVPMPSDANYVGDIFGGWIMSQVDIAGSIPAIRLAQGRVATVAVNSFVFKKPVMVGDVVSFYAKVVAVGRTSITVDVEVYAERRQAEHTWVKVTEATLTYVAVDDHGHPRPVVVSAQQ